LTIEVVVSGFTEQVGGAIASHLESLGYSPEQAEWKETLPVAARGNNIVVVAPPSPVHALPVLAGICHALAEGEGTRGLLLVPHGTLDAWTRVLAPLAAASGLRLHAGEGQARAARLLGAGQVDLLLTTPENAVALQQRATLKVDALKAIVLAWPELWADDSLLTSLMTDAKEAQRAVLTAEPTAAAGLVERYARKAITIGAPGHDQSSALPLGPVRTVSVTDGERPRALATALEVLDATELTIWAADPAGVAEVRAALAGRGGDLPVVHGEVEKTKTVIAWDLPTRNQLERLIAAGEVILLLPPHAERWAGIALKGRRPLPLPGAVEVARDDAAKRRAQVSDLLAVGSPNEGLLALAPLFERYDATLVAAALYQLGKVSAAHAPVAPTAAPAAVVAGTMWVSAGSADGITTKDIVGALVNEIKVDRGTIGKVDVREKFSLVELPAADVARVSQAFTGTTLRRKRVLARPDQARTGGAPRGDRKPSGPRGDRPTRSPRTDRPPRRD
jgi:hypothetical protein